MILFTVVNVIWIILVMTLITKTELDIRLFRTNPLGMLTCVSQTIKKYFLNEIHRLLHYTLLNIHRITKVSVVKQKEMSESKDGQKLALPYTFLTP